ncbi:MAG: DUF1858 domain-containing protein [Armatimonadetes bacterium]|nr:DUF1858 domain-containing protein [Armatimonadota bacterium]
MITKDMTIAQVVRQCPCLNSVLSQLGLACCHCFGAETDTVEQVARVYGLDPDIVVHTLNVASLFPPESGYDGHPRAE